MCPGNACVYHLLVTCVPLFVTPLQTADLVPLILNVPEHVGGTGSERADGPAGSLAVTSGVNYHHYDCTLTID